MICLHNLLYGCHECSFCLSYMSSQFQSVYLLIYWSWMVSCQLHMTIATFTYFSSISSGTWVHVMFTCSVGCLVVWPFTDLRLGPNMSSALRIFLSCNIAIRDHIAFNVHNKIFSTQSSYYVLQSKRFFSTRVLSNRIFRFIAIYFVDQYGPDVICYIWVI